MYAFYILLLLKQIIYNYSADFSRWNQYLKEFAAIDRYLTSKKVISAQLIYAQQPSDEIGNY